MALDVAPRTSATTRRRAPQTRAALAAVADVEQRKTNEMLGAELGYRYVDSPLIADEPGEAPEHDFMNYVPSTWPGVRLPHVWLADGTRGAGPGRLRPRLHAAAVRLRRPMSAASGEAFAARGAPYGGARPARHRAPATSTGTI